MNEDRPYALEYEAFSDFVRGKRIFMRHTFLLLLKSVFSLSDMLVRYIPGALGYRIRYYYKLFLAHLGKNVLIDVGVSLNGPKNISIGDYAWIDSYCRIDAMLGKITIGKRVHIASFSIIGAREPITIDDYVGISAGVKIYSNSEHHLDGKRMSGPMIPEEWKAFHSRPIRLHKDSFAGANSVLLPGTELREGAVVGANCVIKKVIEPYDIVAAPFGRSIGKRDPVNVPEL